MVLSCGTCPGARSVQGYSRPSPCKLNIFLEVLGRRPDGFHDLDTVMLRTSFADHLSVQSRPDDELTLKFSDATPEQLRTGIPLDHHNLILRAAEAFRIHAGIRSGADFVLHKVIPPESGLGGGSGNAAAALLLCRDVWQAAIPDKDLHRIAAALGSDINFLLSGYPAAVCRGRGEQIHPVALHRTLRFLALRPSRGNCTADVFRGTSPVDQPRSCDAIVAQLSDPSAQSLQPLLFNRLTEAACHLNPGMAVLMGRLQTLLRRPVFMSGSGSTVFVMAESQRDRNSMSQLVRDRLHRPVWHLDCIPETADGAIP